MATTEEISDFGLASGFCYAFSSVEDFEYANVEEELGGMEHL